MVRLIPNLGKKKSLASRLFVNHIHVMSSKFANWEPSIEIKVLTLPILIPVVPNHQLTARRLWSSGQGDSEVHQEGKHFRRRDDG